MLETHLPLSGPGVSVCNSNHDAITWRVESRIHLSRQTRPSTERSRKASNVRGIPSRPDDQLRWVQPDHLVGAQPYYRLHSNTYINILQPDHLVGVSGGLDHTTKCAKFNKWL